MTAIAAPGETLWNTSGDMLWSCLDRCSMARLLRASHRTYNKPTAYIITFNYWHELLKP